MHIQHSDNIHEFFFNKKTTYLLISDVHFDNPKCRRDLLKKHLDKAKQLNAKVFINGDFFCIMQGLTDRRHKKGDLRPEHLGNNYFDLVVNEAVEWFAPYADIIAWIGYGNHETSVLGRAEHDVLKSFVTLMNYTKGANIQLSGYSGWLLLTSREEKNNTSRTFKVFHYHGSGGGGPVTKGVIQDNRLMSMVDNADCIWHGHVHELYHHINTKAYINAQNKKSSWKNVHVVRTSTYKDEYDEGKGGWHIERGGFPKPLGGYWLTLESNRDFINVDFLPCVEQR